jgi:hypothetical protein
MIKTAQDIKISSAYRVLYHLAVDNTNHERLFSGTTALRVAESGHLPEQESANHIHFQIVQPSRF